MEQFQFEHAGKVITLFDFSHANLDDIIRRISDYKEFVIRQPQRSLLTLTDLTGVPASGVIVDELKRWALHNKPYVLAGAVIGLSAARRMLVTAVNYFVKRDINMFDTRQKALDWLVMQK